MKVLKYRMSKQNMLTSSQYMELITKDSPNCLDCGIPMAVLFDHGVKGKDPSYFCGHCGLVVKNN